MASILDRYGIKEVADVTFYKIDPKTGKADYPVLYLDTLKVSTIEQTAETADARGGKGNPKLVTWDYGKEITVTIEDALFSAKSMAIMFGDGKVGSNSEISRTVTLKVIANTSGNPALPEYFTADVYDKDQGAARKKVYFGSAQNDGISLADSKLTIEKVTTEEGTTYKVSNNSVTLPAGVEVGDRLFLTYKAPAKVNEIVISAETFPGTYYVAGDTYARSDIDGSDQFFQFIIPKAKMTAENTITLEAEGDPAVFSMNLTVLRPEDGEMMKLVQYELTAESPVEIDGPTKLRVEETQTYTANISGGTWSTPDGSNISIEDDEVTGVAEGAAKLVYTTASGETGSIMIEVLPKAN